MREVALKLKTFYESITEMESILHRETFRFLGLSVDGVPYVVPLNYGYIKGRILFHCALTGKKLDYIRANPQVCFTVGRQSGALVRHPQGALCHVENDSVVCYGIARIVEDIEERRVILTAFNHCLKPEAEEITFEAASRCCAVEIKVTEMTGRKQSGSKYIHWRHRFKE
jgi:nitroimidazol reductase NimA-like FMN-containing flavoprotein (pyridoxamine 5'-phosphate oxidase superfamily)